MSENGDPMFNALSDFMIYFRIERRLADLTCKAYECDVRACLDFLHSQGVAAPAEIRPPDLRRFLAQEATRRPAPSSQVRTVAALRYFFRLCIESDYLQRDPAHVVLTPKKREVLPDVLDHAELPACWKPDPSPRTLKSLTAQLYFNPSVMLNPHCPLATKSSIRSLNSNFVVTNLQTEAEGSILIGLGNHNIMWQFVTHNDMPTFDSVTVKMHVANHSPNVSQPFTVYSDSSRRHRRNCRLNRRTQFVQLDWGRRSQTKPLLHPGMCINDHRHDSP